MTKIQGFQQYVDEHEEVDIVWFNKRQQWCFSETEDFSISFTRDEILASDFEKKLNKVGKAQVELPTISQTLAAEMEAISNNEENN